MSEPVVMTKKDLKDLPPFAAAVLFSGTFSTLPTRRTVSTTRASPPTRPQATPGSPCTPHPTLLLLCNGEQFGFVCLAADVPLGRCSRDQVHNAKKNATPPFFDVLVKVRVRHRRQCRGPSWWRTVRASSPAHLPTALPKLGRKLILHVFEGPGYGLHVKRILRPQ